MATAVASAACVSNTPLEPAPELPLIHAVLNAAADSQFVLVSGTRGGLEAAKVTIASATRVYDLTNVVDTSFSGITSRTRFVIPTLLAEDRLQPGATYRLEVHMQDGSLISSTATVPAVPAASAATTVSEESHAFGANLPVGWERVPGVDRYLITVAVGIGDFFGTRVTYSRFSDGPVVLTPNELNLIDGFSGSSIFYVSVAVADQNYERYYSTRTDPFSGTTYQSQFVNAYGVFGAVTPIKRTRYTLHFNNPGFPMPMTDNNHQGTKAPGTTTNQG